MGRHRKISSSQRAMFKFLREHETKKKTFSASEFGKAAGVQPDTIRTYISKGYFSEFLIPIGKDDQFQAQGVAELSEGEFHQSITQTQSLRELRHFCRYPLSKSLLRKSRDNMILALELYNRPSLENRLDAFVVLFCIAWEQLLKAQIVEKYSENKIFRAAKTGQYRETISLMECLELLYESSDFVRKNVEQIKFLRDEATHLLMPEVQGLLSLVFQAGVLNFAEAFKKIAQVPFLPQSSVGLLTLIMEQRKPTVAALESTYGEKTAREMLDMIQTLESNIRSANNTQFAISVEYKLVFTKSKDKADITLAKASGATSDAVVIDKPVDYRRTHPYFTSDVVEHILKKLRQQLPTEELKKRERFNPKGQAILFNKHDFFSVVFKEGWKKSDKNEYHYSVPIKSGNQHVYSMKAMDFIVDKIVRDAQYLYRARDSYSRARAKSRKRSKATT